MKPLLKYQLATAVEQKVTHRGVSGLGEVTGMCALGYWKNSLESKYYWASNTLLQECNRSKEKGTPELGRETLSAAGPCRGPPASFVDKA